MNVAVTSEVVLFVCECGRDTMYGSRGHYVWFYWFVNVAMTSEVVLFVCECGRDTRVLSETLCMVLR